MGRQERKVIIESIENVRKSKLICYLTSDRPNLIVNMQKDILPILDEHLRTFGKTTKVDVLIMTLGGDILTGFGFSQLLREYASEIGVLIPDKCQSSGTLFALGANEIYMSPAATLSPIDPSTNGPLNPQVSLNGVLTHLPLSVESVAGFKSLAQQDWNLTESGLSEAFSLLAKNVHPLALGNVFRTREQIELLAEKLLRQHRKDDDNIKNIITTLTKKLGSHDYLIYRTEAKWMMGQQIKSDIGLEKMMWDLYKDFQAELKLGETYTWKQTLYDKVPNIKGGPIGIGTILRHSDINIKTIAIESSSRTDFFEENIEFAEQVTAMNFSVPVTTVSVVNNSAGWKTYS